MFLNVYKKIFHISHVRISEIVKGVLMLNLQHTVFIWRPRYWPIFRSALVCLDWCLVIGLNSPDIRSEIWRRSLSYSIIIFWYSCFKIFLKIFIHFFSFFYFHTCLFKAKTGFLLHYIWDSLLFRRTRFSELLERTIILLYSMVWKDYFLAFI